MSERDDWAEINRLEAENARLRAELAKREHFHSLTAHERDTALAERDALRAELSAAKKTIDEMGLALVKQSAEMTDKCAKLAAYRKGAQEWQRNTYAIISAERDALRAQLDAANEALLIGEMMLSELGINASEKCQMAYDHLNRYRTSDE